MMRKPAENRPITYTQALFPITSDNLPITPDNRSDNAPPLTGGFSGPAGARPKSSEGLH